MIKRVLAPVQAWVLLQGKCVGCGTNLALGKKLERRDNTHQVTCSCGRVFIFLKTTGKYRRAEINEIKSI